MKPAHSPTLLIMALAVPLVTACAAMDDGPHPLKEGWHQVRVEQIAPGTDIHHSALRDCRDGLPDDQLASHQFAVLSYPHLRSRHTVILPLADGAVLQPGEVFDAQVNTCQPIATPEHP